MVVYDSNKEQGLWIGLYNMDRFLQFKPGFISSATDDLVKI
jgi:hypothetical protein